MSKGLHQNEVAVEMQSVLETHPDYELFCRLGSPQNFLTRQYGTGGEIDRSNVTHYTHSQVTFANYAMKSLINLVRDFDWKRGGFTMEDVYRRICEDRLMISLKTPANFLQEAAATIAYHNVFGGDQYLPASIEERRSLQHLVRLGNLHQDIEYREDDFRRMQYVESASFAASSTRLDDNNKYRKYHNITNSQKPFSIMDLRRALGEDIEIEDFIDSDTNIGGLMINEKGEIEHVMGYYRIAFDRIESTSVENRIARVDKITDGFAKKSLESEDDNEAMKYALAFGILRGYNLRSVIGACFAQEMSLRWIFAQKDWQQFNKMPGVYLDIEASILGEYGKEKTDISLGRFLDKQITDLQKANGVLHGDSVEITPDALFDVPRQQESEDFIIYLIETRSYREEDLDEIVSCQNVQRVFNIAAKNGDKNFFDVLSQKCVSDQEFKSKLDDITENIDRAMVLNKAVEYGPEVAKSVTSLIKPSKKVTADNHVKLSPSPTAVNEF